jgi:hypothetical protein
MTPEERLDRLELQHGNMSVNLENFATALKRLTAQYIKVLNRVVELEKQQRKYKMIDGHLKEKPPEDLGKQFGKGKKKKK